MRGSCRDVRSGHGLAATKSPAGIALGLIQRGGSLANDDQIVVPVRAITAAWRPAGAHGGRVRMSEAPCAGCGRAAHAGTGVVLSKPPIIVPERGLSCWRRDSAARDGSFAGHGFGQPGPAGNRRWDPYRELNLRIERGLRTPRATACPDVAVLRPKPRSASGLVVLVTGKCAPRATGFRERPSGVRNFEKSQ